MLPLAQAATREVWNPFTGWHLALVALALIMVIRPGLVFALIGKILNATVGVILRTVLELAIVVLRLVVLPAAALVSLWVAIHVNHTLGLKLLGGVAVLWLTRRLRERVRRDRRIADVEKALEKHGRRQLKHGETIIDVGPPPRHATRRPSERPAYTTEDLIAHFRAQARVEDSTWDPPPPQTPPTPSRAARRRRRFPWSVGRLR